MCQIILPYSLNPMNKAPLVFLSIALCLSVTGCARKAPPAPVTELGLNIDSLTGAIVVDRGDNLYDIAKRFKLPLQDIVTLNNIAPPYVLQAGERLKLPAPRTYKVKYLDSLYRISRMFGVSVTELARMNNMSAPYELSGGQVLTIPSKASKVKQNSYAQKQDHNDEQKQAIAPRPSVERHKIASPAKVKSQQKNVRPSATSAKEFSWPVQGRVISSYGPKGKGLHNDGVNILAPRGTPVAVAKSGMVVYTGNALEGFGNLVIVRHDNGWVTAYAHLDRISVARGAVVKKGQALGTIGSTGRVESPQLHFEIRRGSEALNPEKFLG